MRKRGPNAIRAIVDKSEELRSLRTRPPPEEAKQRYAVAIVALDDKWLELSAQSVAAMIAEPKSLTEREAHQRAQWMFDFWLSQHCGNPGQQTFWPTNLHEKLWHSPSALLDALSKSEGARLEAVGEARRLRKLES